MLFEIVTIPSGTLNSGLNTQQLTDVTLANSLGHQLTRPVNIKINNNSGQEVLIGLWTSYEYDEWIADNSVSDLLPIADSGSEEFDNPRGEIEYITTSGSTGHTGSIIFNIIRE